MEKSRDKESSRDEYRRTRETFKKMNVEEQATFLVEATASVLARGMEEVGRVVADGLSDLFRPKDRQRRRAAHPHGPGPHGPGPAEPETAQQRRPRGGSHETT
jgi:hypothetical protein